MPKTNDPEVVRRILPNLPQRLKELRMEMGWSLDDVAKVTGVTQRGVVSNWEAMNQRRRTPPISTMLILQQWYGVSLDYLVGHRGAERESSVVKEGKATLRAALRGAGSAELAEPSERARTAVRLAGEVAPEAFFPERLAACLMLGQTDWERLMRDGVWPDGLIRRLAQVLGLNDGWFYAVDTSEVSKAIEL